MNAHPHISGLAVLAGLAVLCTAACCLNAQRKQDEVRNLKRGDVVPAYALATAGGTKISSAGYKGKIVVLIYLSAEQRSSERAVTDAKQVLGTLKRDDVELLLVTADIVYKAYFKKFLDEAEVNAPLAFDTARDLYGMLGLIVFPTTILIDREGRLKHVIVSRRTDYSFALDSFLRHTLGLIDDKQLTERLKARSLQRGSPKSLASRHRAAARLLREKGLLEAAEKELALALKIDPKNVHILLDLADLLTFRGRHEESVPIVGKVLELDPRSRRGKLLKGVNSFKSGDLEEAQAILEEALILNPDPALTHYYLGRIQEQKGDKDRAIKHYRAAIDRLLLKK